MNYGLGNVLGNTQEQLKDQFGHLRKAGSILKGHPLGAIVTELVFPEPTAAGTLDAEYGPGGNMDKYYPKSRVH